MPMNQCDKVQVHRNGTEILGCRDSEGQPTKLCDRGGGDGYRDVALPLSEFLCQRVIADHSPHMGDAFKQSYVKVCHNLDEALADPYKAGSAENLRQRFDAMERELQAMIDSPELTTGDNGRYLYHIDARVLHSFLPAFWYRAENGLERPMPREIIDDTYRKVADLLDDFSGMYSNIVTQVALRRTQVEILALLLRTKDASKFPFPTLFREDASETHAWNHDAYIIAPDSSKIRIQVASADYRLPNGQKKSASYGNDMLIAIHQTIVNLDYRDGGTITTPVKKEATLISHEHEISDDDKYAEYDSPPRHVVWGAHSVERPQDSFEGDYYIQELGGVRRDGLASAIVEEARGGELTLTERNLLNGATHYLIAMIREKQGLA